MQEGISAAEYGVSDNWVIVAAAVSNVSGETMTFRNEEYNGFWNGQAVSELNMLPHGKYVDVNTVRIDDV
jgi:hypothetical protein